MSLTKMSKSRVVIPLKVYFYIRAKPAIKTTVATRKNAKHPTRSNAKHQNQHTVTNRQSRFVTGCQCTAVRTGKSARKYPRNNVGQNTRMIAEKYLKKYARPQKT